MRKTPSFIQALHSWADACAQHSMRGWAHHARSTGLSMPQFSILMQLYHRGSCNLSDISQHFETSNAASSQLVDKLVQAGYLDRTEDPSDRRTKMITLRPLGLEMIKNSMRERYRWVDELSTQLTPEEQEQVRSAMQLMSRVVTQVDPAG